MQLTVGDHIVVRGRRVGETGRRGTVVDVRGQGGLPPYLIRWDADGHEGLIYPGPDTVVERKRRTKRAPA
jgi:Domain of unknown function (DUF1918)